MDRPAGPPSPRPVRIGQPAQQSSPDRTGQAGPSPSRPSGAQPGRPTRSAPSTGRGKPEPLPSRSNTGDTPGRRRPGVSAGDGPCWGRYSVCPEVGNAPGQGRADAGPTTDAPASPGSGRIWSRRRGAGQARLARTRSDPEVGDRPAQARPVPVRFNIAGASGRPRAAPVWGQHRGVGPADQSGGRAGQAEPRPAFLARTIAAARSGTCSLAKIDPTWLRTVLSATTSRCAICR